MHFFDKASYERPTVNAGRNAYSVAEENI